MKKIFIYLLLSITFVGCNSKKTAEELFNNDASGVVVILNEFYYKIQIPNRETIYFTGIDNEGNLENFTLDINEIIKNRKMLTGTGFFIDKEGSILTNRHVAQPTIDIAQAKQGFIGLIRSLKELLQGQLENMQSEYYNLDTQKSNCTYYDNYGNPYTDQANLSEIVQKQSEIETNFNELLQTYNNLDANLDPEALIISSVCEIGIAYNNTFVTNDKDFIDKNPCVVVRVSEKEDVDLALIQLKNKKTPNDSYIFTTAEQNAKSKSFTKLFSGNKDEEKLKINQQLYMIGYNAGLTLANTQKGINVQMTSGKLTQLPDGQRLLYSIPTLQGSSGSPVIDEYGNLVAVNFAKLSGTDNFNFGIPVEKIKDFMKW
ncbi:S1 family peptidase [Bacteroides sedimenti]